MKTSDRILFDTNVLVYNQDRESEFYKQAKEYHQLVFSGQLNAVIS